MRHIKHLLVAGCLGFLVLVTFVVALTSSVPDDFTTHDNGWYYRHGSLKDRSESPPLTYADDTSCLDPSCHGEDADDKSLTVFLDGGHTDVGCQACHRAAQTHVASDGAQDPPVVWTSEDRLPAAKAKALSDDEADAYDGKMAKALIAFCLGCHLELPGKPDDYPQITSFEEHRDNMGDGDEPGCTWCHDYHTCEVP